MATIEPTLAGPASACPWRVLGVGMGLIVSQLGNVVQSSVDASGRGEAGGLQYTGQQLGSSLGVALIGAIVLAGLTSAFVSNIEDDDRISTEVADQVSVAAGPGIDFVASDQVEAAAQAAGLDDAEATRSSTTTRTPQLLALKAGLLAAAFLALLSLAFTGDLPHGRRRGGRRRGGRRGAAGSGLGRGSSSPAGWLKNRGRPTSNARSVVHGAGGAWVSPARPRTATSYPDRARTKRGQDRPRPPRP